MPELVKFHVEVHTSDGIVYGRDLEIPRGTFLTSMTVSVDGAPLIGVPFSIHDRGGYHTICRRAIDDDEIDQVWTE